MEDLNSAHWNIKDQILKKQVHLQRRSRKKSKMQHPMEKLKDIWRQMEEMIENFDGLYDRIHPPYIRHYR